ncbi:Aminotransferase [Mycena sanguinolenta]|uniref:Aminotransferase n=1 Tax=Mycena sanguinolenta TaxID=230812 RepID=A0A8H7DEL6_9AGAR|nr:Aminotransferase [Mycena sanguinolenta]
MEPEALSLGILPPSLRVEVADPRVLSDTQTAAYDLKTRAATDSVAFLLDPSYCFSSRSSLKLPISLVQWALALWGGDSIAHLALEERPRQFFFAPAALLFNSDFHANASVLGSLPQSGDIIIFDEYIHASCHDGMKMSRAKDALIPFKHNSLSSFKECILRALQLNPGIKAGKATVFIVVEGLYSMDGDVAPLKEIVELMKSLIPPESRHLIVEEAHSSGIYGQAGRGLVSLNGLENEVHTRVHTFGKALGSAGAVVLTDAVIRLYLINYARSFIYTTSLPLFNVVAIGCSFDMLELVGDELSARLVHLCRFFRNTLSSNLKLIPAKIMTLTKTGKENLWSPIFPILVCGSLDLEACLQAKGYDAKAIPYPIVPRGAERIRVCIHAANTEDELLRFITELVSWAAAYQQKDGKKERNIVL